MSDAPLISVEEALARLDAETDRLPTERCPISRSYGRILAEAIIARHDSPPFDNSAMDGFAVRASDLADASHEAPATVPIQGDVNAGDREPQSLQPGLALRINTGAPLPGGADAVVPIERVELDGSRVRFFSPVAEGAAIRRAGEDFRSGRAMLPAGRRLDPTALGLLASLGYGNVTVSRRPRVALLATGDELVEPGNPLGHGQIYDSSRYALAALLESLGAEIIDLHQTTDDPEMTRTKLTEGLEHDVLVTTGGVSMGSRDLIRPTLLDLGAREIFWKVAQRPGKPLFLARTESGTLCFGLPGNPVSVFVTALVYLRRALLKMQGCTYAELPWEMAIASETFDKPAHLTTFSRADNTLNGESGNIPSSPGARVAPHSAQGSHQFSALSQAGGLVRIRAGVASIGPGEQIEYLDFRRLFGR